jgi:hypothetical protein
MADEPVSFAHPPVIRTTWSLMPSSSLSEIVKLVIVAYRNVRLSWMWRRVIVKGRFGRAGSFVLVREVRAFVDATSRRFD